MKRVPGRKSSLQDSDRGDDLKGKSPHDLIGMMWQLALNAWAFKDNVNPEPRLQRHIVVVKKRNSIVTGSCAAP